MIDFIEYVVAELKSKRLSKSNAAALVRQFSRRAAGTVAAMVTHPLLHRNTSDLSEQRFSSTFSGNEFFLADHRVKTNGHAGRKVLPGVAYLEMARAAIEEALPASPEPAALELRNTVWAQPIVVAGMKEVSIALLPGENDEIDFEIYSGDAGEETVHCQGRALSRGASSRESVPPRVDLDQLSAQMEHGRIEADGLYATCTRMGLLYGPSFQGVTAIRRGNGQLLAELRLPSVVAGDAGDYVLHPSLMDGALQACVGLIEPEALTRPRVPFALDTLRVFSPCTTDMIAWVRYAPGSHVTDNVVKLDIDLCDQRGNVAVQLRGFASRVLGHDGQAGATGTVLATPVWEACDSVVASDVDYTEHDLVLCELPDIDGEKLVTLLPNVQSLSLEGGPRKAIAERYCNYALACFELIQAILHGKPRGKVLVQIAVADRQENALHAGLSGLLRTAALENPLFVGQLILVPADVTTEELARCLEAEKSAVDALVRYEQGVRQLLRWKEVAAEQDVAAANREVAFHNEGVYLITGGRGGLGALFTKEILDRTRGARVVLTGRSANHEALPDRVTYRQVDLTDLDQVEQLIAGIRSEYGRLDGILHSAGMIADNFILRKANDELTEVLAPKVAGTCNLDRATKDIELDFFVLFSAVAGVMGNLGQADYATANAFMDSFAAYRNRQVAAGQRHGRTRSIDWPLWQAGGLGVDAASRERLREATGMLPMQTATGLDAFHRSLTLSCDQLMVVEGDVGRIRRTLLATPAAPAAPRAVVAAPIDAESLTDKTRDYLRKELSGLLKVPPHEIDVRAALENYGIDSILAMKLTNQLEKTFGSLSKTLFFEYQTIRDLADYFVAQHAAPLTALFGTAKAEATVSAAAEPAVSDGKAETGVGARTKASGRRFSRSPAAVPAAKADDEPIAIIGLSGRYPEAVDVEAYWNNLRDGKDCIVEIPKERWDWREYFTEDRGETGRHYSKWGGFIAGVDEFDPLFFNISPVDAELIDPQERLFLQHAWMAVEDAGYTRASLQAPSEQDLPGQVGVYVGVMYTEYQLFGAESTARGKRMGVIGSFGSVANRVSYALNLHGPSMTLDTMCSSSLTAIHIACQDLKQGRTGMAIAGGVNVTIHPNKYLILSDGQFISGDGHCQSFGEGGDGYIPGEGVGAVILKRLSDAVRDGDHIYGVLRGSALNHGGKTNGYSVPNPQAQSTAIARALAESKINPRHISYIEAHGTGTKLGDPIEIAALNKAFRQSTQDTQFCLIGSAKSNVGHCESAAGIAGLTKVLLQMQHRQIVPSLHSAQLNPHIDFPKSPFIVNQELKPWEQPVIDGRVLPRIAGISSFGAGGSNAHMIVQEYEAPARQPMVSTEVVIVLSARTPEQLTQKAHDLADFVRPRVSAIDLAALGYTLQIGREPMDERLGFVVTSADQLVEKLDAYVAGRLEDAFRGQVRRNNATLSQFATDGDLQQAIDRWIASRKLAKILDFWAQGLELDWSKLYGETKPPRISLPTYPFARERYWIDVKADTIGAPASVAPSAVLHPLLHSNISDLSEQRYSSTFTGDEFFLADHRVAANRVLPGVAYLEMARAAIAQALPAGPESMVLELRDTVWAQPIVVSGSQQVRIALLANDDEQLDYEIYSDDETVHCQGRAVFSGLPAARLDFEQLESRMTSGRMTADSVYAICARMGLVYGPAFRGVTAIHRGNGEVLAELRLPNGLAENDFVLHPSLMDGALQAAVGLIDPESARTQPRLPFALETLRVLSPCTPEMFAWVRYAAGSSAGDKVVKLDLDVCDTDGNVCVQMRGFSSRLLTAGTQETGTLIATPVWEASPAEAGPGEYVEQHVVLCELPDVDAAQLGAWSLQGDVHKTIAHRYTEYAMTCFARIQSILESRPRGRVLFRVVAADGQEQVLFAGLSALLKSAALENPNFIGQLVLVSPRTTTEELAARLRNEQPFDALVRFEEGTRQVLRWQEVRPDEAPVPFKDDGVYLITGGLGALGTLFANEILGQTREARVILTGRSALSEEAQARLDARVSYRQVDLADPDAVQRLIAAINYDYHRLNGVLHCAGKIADGFLLKKTAAEFAGVLAPKVTATFNLDQATSVVDLDFFVLFSSLAGALGNVGQADYATANGFMDQFSAYRNRLVAARQRHGRTLSINWPLWQDGGMDMDPTRQELLRQTTGMQPMQTGTGLQAFRWGLGLACDQMLVVEGDLAKLRRALLAGAAMPARPKAEQPVVVLGDDLVDKTRDYLRRQLSALLKMPSHKIDPQAALETYGIDSILAMKLTAQLEKTFGSLSKTLFFEYQTIQELGEYFAANHAPQLAEILSPGTARPTEVAGVLAPQAPAKLNSSRRFSRPRAAASAAKADDDPIAIIGLSGRYPEAVDIEAYWENLRDGKDCITEVPKERWDWREYFSEDRTQSGRHFSKWGGFIAGVDEFDPMFFNMAPLEAEYMDPQERLFLQHTWMAIEDAGYTRASLQVPQEQDLAGQAGVYVGVMYNEYQLFGAEAAVRGKRMALPGSVASIANRVSYALNLHGPSVTFDTMCSSSLTAIHFACQDLKLGRTSLAIAGGVNVTIHPNKYLVLSAGQFISGDGHCASFGEGGDGYIPGEGVGVVVLKRLSEAKRDGDQIHGIIRGSALNHGGKTNGYTVPNPQAQATAISRALAESHTDARHISYIEAHGTGTKLGDPIEIAALGKAFHHFTQDTEFCRIGSAKSNIGHCESAAGVAGLTKVLLQMRHRQIVPSLHSEQLNPHIDFAKSPFVVNQELRPWEAPVVDGRTLPRIAGISSFGAGGSNAHLIIEEYQAPVRQPVALPEAAILLSARTPEQLRQKAQDLVAFVTAKTIDLADLAYTLQVGRESMEERLGFIVSSVVQLVEKLQAYVDGEEGIEDAYQGQGRRNNDLALFRTDADLQRTIDMWLAGGKLANLLDLWAKGLDLDWSKVYGVSKPRRISLPTYPFAKERYWIEVAAGEGAASAVLHPLLHSNTSDLSEQRYRSTFTGDEFFLADHQVKARKVLPAVAYLEMARAAIEEALPARGVTTLLELRNTVWVRPVVVNGTTAVNIALSKSDDEAIDYEIYSEDADEEIVHCQGRAVLRDAPAPAKLDLEMLEAQMAQGQSTAEEVYAACERMGLVYGPGFRGITAVHRGTDQLLAKLRLPNSVPSDDYVLHPTLMDGALQACVALMDGSDTPRVPFALETLRIMSPCTSEMVAWVRISAADSIVKLDVDLCDDRGNVCVQMHGLSSRALSGEAPAIGNLLATPLWQTSSISGDLPEVAERQVILCELPQGDALDSVVLSLQYGQQTIAQRYSDYAVACFERLQTILGGRPQDRVLVQIVVTEDRLAGLSGLLRTAALENPRVTGQVICVPADIPADELGRRLREEQNGRDGIVRYEGNTRQVLRWQEVAASPEAPSIAFKDDGVYLITGGLGSLGVLFARDILGRTRNARVVLTGRSPLVADQALFNGLFVQSDRVSFRQLDLTDFEQVSQLIASIRSESGRLDGILHSAGMVADGFILKKESGQFREVLAPKVTGTFHLDEASRDVELDFFVLFSSVAGALGNVGQADYAAANGFMDRFAAYRNRQVAAGQRHGRTRSINWPLWRAGGMSIDPTTQELLEQTTGMHPMRTATGIDAFHRILALPHDEVLVAEGDLAQMRRAFVPASAVVVASRVEPTTTDMDGLAGKTQDFLRREFAAVLKLPYNRIDPNAALEQYGLDSILAMKLTNRLEQTFGSLVKTLFYEYQTIAALAGYFLKAYPAIVAQTVGVAQEETQAKPIAVEKKRSATRGKSRRVGSRTPVEKEIAIVGLGGRYPQAETLLEFWKNLRGGRDCVTEIPADRWDHRLYFDADSTKAGKSYSKWGGFIPDVDKFDPLFFNISPKEAELLDPQERLFLQTAWETIEDAGYSRESVSGSRFGVYVGVMWGQYELYGAEAMAGGSTSFPGSSYASIANRVSYVFDFHGPSIALDTMCSSSLTAIHLACDALRKGEIEAAIAGGVNVTIHPYKYLSLSQGKFAASDGRCRAFGAGGDGYVPGEGVGAVLLKPLENALRDGDQIYAVIKSTGINHGGKTNGYSVPNPNAQGELIADALLKAKIDPKTLSYIETHGTGTSLGDPIEIAGLLKAFEGAGGEKQSCPIGSVKSNIGHLESAAGIASLTKALLQIRYNELVPSLHASPLNPNIDFENSPFRVQTELAEWTRTGERPRRVGVSSFGAGGSNGHVIVEEYVSRSVTGTVQPEVFVLSARDHGALRRYAQRVVDFLGEISCISLANIAYTSQVGRTPMDVRLAIVTSSIDDLKAKLSQWLATAKSEDVEAELEDVFYGNVRTARYGAGSLVAGQSGKAFLQDLLANRELERIAGLWILGVVVDWSRMHADPRRVSLPTYPFAKERHWVAQTAPALPVAGSQPAEEKHRTYYFPQWTPKAIAARKDELPGPILIVDPSEDLSRTMAGADSIILVKPGQSDEEARELVESLGNQGRLPAVVVHNGSAASDLEDGEPVERQLENGLYTLFHLCKALTREKHGALRIVSVFSGDSAATAPLGAAMAGFLKTLTLENPRCQVKVVDVPAGLDAAALIRAEIDEQEWSAQEIRYRDGLRLVRELVTRDVQPEAALPLRQNGVYVITGGIGGLGLIFAEHLAKNYRAKLVLAGRSVLNAAQEESLRRLESYGAEVLHLQGDVSRREDVERIVREAKARFAEIHGVIHSAGVNRDAFILRKTRDEMEAVLAPKVYGAIHLDVATRDENLDFFVLFSSLAGVTGNMGQCDYAFANRFLDAFAEQRNAQKRSGRTLSIDWPLWEDGGMTISSDDVAFLEQQTGIAPLPTQDGIQYWEDLLRIDVAQGVALYGAPSKIAASLNRRAARPQRVVAATSKAVIDGGTLSAKTEAYLKERIGEELKLAADRIGSSDPLESYGIDSVMINKLNARLERDLGELPKTLFYEHETVRALTAFLLQEAREALISLFGAGEAVIDVALSAEIEQEVVPEVIHDVVRTVEARDAVEPIAIIGMDGRYPQSATLREYWENLQQGRDLIGLVPPDRWDYEELYHPDPGAATDGKIYCKWGGFLADHDKFDPRFFKIPTADAKMMDPQERLFLESVWAAIEDAGYTKEHLRTRFAKAGSGDVGVFVGVTTNSYHLWAPEERSRGNFVAPAAMPWSIANRVSYFFDFNGPSLPIDTACSSSLVAIHLACESLRNRDCQIAIAGGVNLYLHPAKYHSLCQRRMVSLDGKTHSYGAGDDGFVPGEGVGSIVLKPLRKAVEDGDHVYAVIRASAFDHSGSSNGYSAPNPNSQANLISHTLEKARIHPESISYIEGHGTGTQLGDSLEIAALTRAFRRQTEKKQFCPIGSVKANLGHSESAAGIAGLAKVVLQMEHGQLAPSIHSDEVNPNIELEDSPFYLQHGLSEWKSSAGQPRRALVNSFGAGGVNACVVVEEYQTPRASAGAQGTGPWLFTLSARNEERLREYVERVLAFVRNESRIDLASLCYTFQSGREAMEERLATVVSNVDELAAALGEWRRGGTAANVHRGRLAPRRGSRRSAKLARGDQSLDELAAKWIAGQELDWESLYSPSAPRRIPVPTYPFARERYWVSDFSPAPETVPVSTPQLHPLVAYNSSTLKEVSFASVLSDTAFYAVDHKVNDERIFPGAAFLEMACITANVAGEQRVRRIQDVVWIQPLSFRNGPQTLRTVLRHAGNTVEYVISSLDDDSETVVHSEGRVAFWNGPADPVAEDLVSIEELKARSAGPETGAAFYEKFREHGLEYGPAFQTVQELYLDGSFALAKLKIADHLKGEFGQFILHPSLLDGALQTVAGLAANLEPGTPYVPFALDEVDIVGPVSQTCYAYAERADTRAPSYAGVTKFNIRLLSENGDVLIKFTNLYVRPLARPAMTDRPLATADAAEHTRLLGTSVVS